MHLSSSEASVRGNPHWTLSLFATQFLNVLQLHVLPPQLDSIGACGCIDTGSQLLLQRAGGAALHHGCQAYCDLQVEHTLVLQTAHHPPTAGRHIIPVSCSIISAAWPAFVPWWGEFVNRNDVPWQPAETAPCRWRQPEQHQLPDHFVIEWVPAAHQGSPPG